MPRWDDPVDAHHAAVSGQRWNPPGVACLYLNVDVLTARNNVVGRFAGLPYGPEDLEPTEAPVLIVVKVPEGLALDAFSDKGVTAVGPPTTYPLDSADNLVAHSVFQPIGTAAYQAGLDGVASHSAAPGSSRELAWFPRSQPASVTERVSFSAWW
ncbi:MAG: RES domain-containing protein [Acidimicrobiaceae bacterium]|nr:RES domain-containing protein [Acidimicrobiaceae bacterium]